MDIIRNDDGTLIVPVEPERAHPVDGDEDGELDEVEPAEPTTRLLRPGEGGYDEALAAFETLSTLEGIMPALESAHAIAYLLREGKRLARGAIVVANLSGRGDKDVQMVAEILSTRPKRTRP